MSEQKAQGPRENQPPPKPKPTKAERRALQEQQRAAKAARLGGQSAPVASIRQQQANKPPASNASSPKITMSKQGPPNKKQDSALPPPQKQQSMLPPPASQQQPPKKQTSSSFLLSHLTQYPPPASVFKLGAVLDTQQPCPGLHARAIELGYLYATKQITGSNARCRAMLDCLLDCMHEYATLSELDSSFKAAFTFWTTQCRPHSTTMGNAFTFIKSIISSLHRTDDPILKLRETMERYQKERIVLSGVAITELLRVKVVKPTDTILTYGHSEIIERLCRAKAIRNLIVVDSAPLHEGRRLLKYASSYVDLSALSYTLQSHRVDKVVLGAAALQSDGSITARVGTALVCQIATLFGIPVVFGAETYKISNRVHLDSITVNELYGGGGGTSHHHHLLYDLTPPEFVTGIATELGIVPPTSIAVLLREMNPQELKSTN